MSDIDNFPLADINAKFQLAETCIPLAEYRKKFQVAEIVPLAELIKNFQVAENMTIMINAD